MTDPHIQHRLNCTHPNIHTTRGITKDLHTCRTCGAETLTLKPAKRVAMSEDSSLPLGVKSGRMDPAKTNRPTRERRTVLSTPSATNGKEAVDS